jgi:hypothetical protein
MKRTCVLFLAFSSLLCAAAAHAQVGGVTYRRYLLPVVLDGSAPTAGALGSLW